jgi:hypothetical protein
METVVTETSLISIAAIMTGIGGALLPTDHLWGGIILLGAVIILVLRGWLKKKGIVAKAQ